MYEHTEHLQSYIEQLTKLLLSKGIVTEPEIDNICRQLDSLTYARQINAIIPPSMVNALRNRENDLKESIK